MIPDTFFSWEQLGTYAGATVAVMLLVQFTKGLPGIRNIPTRIWAYLMAVALLILSTVFTTKNITPSVIVLCVFNAVIVSMAATGGYDTVHDIKKDSAD